MTRLTRRPAWAVLAVSTLAALGCGKKGPPLPPLRPLPARVEWVAVKRLGSDIYLQAKVPAADADGKTPSTIRTVEVLAMTIDDRQPGARAVDDKSFIERATLVERLEVRPPGAEPPEAGAPPPPPDPRPAQGDTVTVVERYTPALLTPSPLPTRGATTVARVEEVGEYEGPPLTPPVMPLREATVSRTYAAVGRSAQNRPGALSSKLKLPLGDTPPSPPAPILWHDERRLVVEWIEPAGARRRTQEPAGEGVLPARPVVSDLPAHTYNVYAWSEPAAGGSRAMPTPLNAKPLEVPSFQDASLEFGVERCYVVRTVEATGVVSVESEASPKTCITPRDEFAPGAPRNLTVVAGEGVINLIWEPNDEADLAGYVVLRGEATGQGLQALTPEPIRENTYRDTNVKPGARYVYAIVAVDNATPQNVSAESNRVEETAR